MEESVDSWEHFAICTSSSTTRHSWHRGVLAMGFITIKHQLLIHANSHNQRELVPLVFASCVDPHSPRNTPRASCSTKRDKFVWCRCGVIGVIINAMGMDCLCLDAFGSDIQPTSPYLCNCNSGCLCVFFISVIKQCFSTTFIIRYFLSTNINYYFFSSLFSLSLHQPYISIIFIKCLGCTCLLSIQAISCVHYMSFVCLLLYIYNRFIVPLRLRP